MDSYVTIPRPLLNEICDGYKKLNAKLKQLQPKKRIRLLAKPKYRCEKFHQKHIERFKRHIQIIRDDPISTRLEQLAIVQVRKLIAARNAYKNFIDPVRYERFNRNIHKSMISMYSRLSNATPPEIKNIVEKWTDKDWDIHKEWLSKRAQPKNKITPLPIRRKFRPISQMSRIEKLAKPKKFISLTINDWKLSAAAKRFIANERIIKLSQPKQISESVHFKVFGKVSRGAWNYKITERTEALAKHREKKTAISNKKENPFSVSIKALKAKPSRRVRQLAAPRLMILPKEIDPYKVSPNALKAEPTDRIKILAQPKVRSKF